MEKLIYERKTFRKWKAAKHYFNDRFNSAWIFRGQRDATWGLATTFDRLSNCSRYKELFLFHEFRRFAGHFIEPTLLPRDTLEWLSLMQHHGVPTRLLDFTSSPYIASYFAIDGSLQHDSDISVWCCFLPLLQNNATMTMREFNYKINSMNKPLNNDPDFKRIFVDGLSKNTNGLKDASCFEYGLVYPVEPFHMNIRFKMQQGNFLMTGNVGKNFEENFCSMVKPTDSADKEIFVKITIDKSQKEEMFYDLNKMGINATSLFPGLDGFSKSLRDQVSFSSEHNVPGIYGTFIREYL